MAIDPVAPSTVTEDPPRVVSRNLVALTLDVALFSAGCAAFDQTTAMPLLLHRLGAGGLVIGLFAALRALAFGICQPYVVWLSLGFRRVKPFLVAAAFSTRLLLVPCAVLVWYAARSRGAATVAIAALFIAYGVFELGDGLGYVPWMEIVARAFTPRTRGRYFAASQFVSGTLGIGVAMLLVQPVLAAHRLPFPHDFAVLVGAAGLALLLSFAALTAVKEREGRVRASRPEFGTWLLSAGPALRSNPVFLRLCAVQLLVGAGAAAQPFYVLYAVSRFHLADRWAGIFQTGSAVSVVALTPLWVWTAERFGAARAVQALAAICAATPLLALMLGLAGPWPYLLVFLILGGSLNYGFWTVFSNYLLLQADDGDRNLAVAFFSLSYMPACLYPALGGLLVPGSRFVGPAACPLLFPLAAAVTACGLVVACKLPNMFHHGVR